MTSKLDDKKAAPDGTGLIALDPWLEPYAERLRQRYRHYQWMRERAIKAGGSLGHFAERHKYLGFNRGQRDGQPGVWYREWAPAAQALFLAGDFNDWNRKSHAAERDEFGIWHLFLPDAEHGGRFAHGTRVKVFVHSALGPRDRIPAYVRRAVYDPHSHDYCGQYWDPAEPYVWRHAVPELKGNLRIYEAHVGMATPEERIGTYREFADRILPRIVASDYNAVQLMAVQEHPYYGHSATRSAISRLRDLARRSLKYLIDHGMGCVFAGPRAQPRPERQRRFEHVRRDGPSVRTPAAAASSDTGPLVFDYGKTGAGFLLSNVRYWLENSASTVFLRRRHKHDVRRSAWPAVQLLRRYFRCGPTRRGAAYSLRTNWRIR